MKRHTAVILSFVLTLGALTSCGEHTSETYRTSESFTAETAKSEISHADTAVSDSPSDTAVETSSAVDSPADSEDTHELKMTVNGTEIRIVLYDTPTAEALRCALPMELSFTDYNGTEKIAYPPESLPTDGEPDGCDPDEGDLCLYAPWGNLCIFYRDFRYSQSLIKLGHIVSGMDAISGMSGDFTVTLERAE